MIKWPIKYKDFNGTQRVEDFWFHITEAEFIELEIIYSKYGVEADEATGTEAQSGFGNFLKEVMASGDGQRIVDAISDLIKRSYGVRTPDGRSHIKTEAEYLIFKGTPAYSKLYRELVYNPDISAAFFNGLFDADLMARANALKAEKEAVPGFRPGADTSRPTPPVAGIPSETGSESPSVANGLPADPGPSLPFLDSTKDYELPPTVETSQEHVERVMETVHVQEHSPEVLARALEIAKAEGHTMRYDPSAGEFIPGVNAIRDAELQLAAEKAAVTDVPVIQPYDQ